MAKSKDVITQIKKATRRRFSADEKIGIVLEGLGGVPRAPSCLCILEIASACVSPIMAYMSLGNDAL